MLPQDASSMLPLCMAVYGSAHGSVRTLPCAQSSVRGSVRQYVALPHCPTLPNCHTTHTLPSALPHIAERTTQIARKRVPCTLPHTTTHTLPHTLPHTAARTVAHCRTLPHAAALLHSHTAPPQLAMRTATHYQAHYCTLPHSLPATHCRERCHILPSALPYTIVRNALTLLRALPHTNYTQPGALPHIAAGTYTDCRTLPRALPHTAHCHPQPHTAAHCRTATHALPHITNRTAAHYCAHCHRLPRTLPRTLLHTAHCHPLPYCRTLPHCHTRTAALPHTLHTIPIALLHTAACTGRSARTLPCLLPHTATHYRTLPRTLPHTAMRTATHSHAHCRTDRTQVAACIAAHYCTLLHPAAHFRTAEQPHIATAPTAVNDPVNSVNPVMVIMVQLNGAFGNPPKSPKIP